jgi:hypothetical protein
MRRTKSVNLVAAARGDPLPEKTFRVALDDEKLETLRRWGEGLTGDPREEVAAAGRAILMLAEEVERLHVDLWNATRLFPQERQSKPDEPPPQTEPASAAQALFERLKQGPQETDDRRRD